MSEMDKGLADRFFPSSESFDASATMANISYASTAPTVGQANSPVSVTIISPHNITSLCLPLLFHSLSLSLILPVVTLHVFHAYRSRLIYATGGYRQRVLTISDFSLGLGTT